MTIQKQPTMSPLDVVVLLRMTLSESENLSQVILSNDLELSQSEISKSLKRSRYAGLIIGDYKVMKQSLMEFIQYGIKYAFPQQPGAIVRGVPTAHSMSPLNTTIQSDEYYVWPSARGKIRGQAITPLFPSVVWAALANHQLHELLALVDAIRVGRARERKLAIKILKERILNEEHTDQPQGHYGSGESIR